MSCLYTIDFLVTCQTFSKHKYLAIYNYVMDTDYCRICGAALTKENRIESHILTRAQYIRPLSAVSTNKILGFRFAEYTRQKFDPSHAIKDNTISCKPCDQKLGTYEDIRIRFTNKTQEYFNGSNVARIIDHPFGSQIKLACLADLFRCSITAMQQYEDISLGAKHERLISEFLSGEKRINYTDYPLVLYKMKTPIRFDAVLAPQKRRIKQQIFYNAVMPGGWCWIVKVDSQRNTEFEELSIDRFQNKMLVVDSNDGQFVDMLFRKIIRAVDGEFSGSS